MSNVTVLRRWMLHQGGEGNSWFVRLYEQRRGSEVQIRIGENELVIVSEVLSEVDQIHRFDAQIELLIHHVGEYIDRLLQLHVLHAGNGGESENMFWR